MNNYNKKGFTLVELLIAVSLIAILSGVIFAVINPLGMQKKTRDSQRVSDLAKIKVALEAYFSDNRTYPNSSGTWLEISPTAGNALNTALENGYVNKLPVDPKATGTLCAVATAWRRYGYKSIDGSNYILTTMMETAGSSSSTCPYTSPANYCNCEFISGYGYYTSAD